MYGFAALVVLSVALQSAPPLRCHAGQSYEGPPPIDRPAAFDLPLGVTGTDPEGSLPASDLDEAAARFAGYAPAFSLAVSEPDATHWHRTPGAGPGARFAAASITKAFTAALIFQLIDEGALALETPVSTWYPELPNAELVTIDHLLSHTSGYYLEAAGPLSGPYRAPEHDFARLVEEGARFCPGTNWAYSNVGYALLGRIIEQVEWTSYADAVQTRLIGPLGLDNTTVLNAGSRDPALVAGHHAGTPVPEVDYATAFAAGGIATDAADLVRFWRALLGGQIVSADSLDTMTGRAWPLFDDPAMFYGRGIQLTGGVDATGPMLMHSGTITGFRAAVAYLAEDDIFVAVMVNDSTVPAEAALWALVRARRGG